MIRKKHDEIYCDDDESRMIAIETAGEMAESYKMPFKVVYDEERNMMVILPSCERHKGTLMETVRGRVPNDDWVLTQLRECFPL